MSAIKYNSRSFFRLGQSGAIFGVAAPALREDYRLKCLSSDMSVTAGLDRFKKMFPNDFYNVGIAEQNLVGIAAGLASEGYKVVAVAQAAFITMRAFEQVRQYLGYMNNSVVLVGINSGFALTFFGNTHYAIEDMALMRSIPGMMVLSPADAGAAVKAFEIAIEMNQPTYIRLTGGLMMPIVYKEDYEYDPFHMTEVVNTGNDVTIFATGSMVYNSVKAAELLVTQGISCRVLDIHCLKPMDEGGVLRTLDSKLLVSVEEHNVNGGLGTAISEILANQQHHPNLLRLGVKDYFSSVGDYNYLLRQHGLTPEQIADQIKKVFCNYVV